MNELAGAIDGAIEAATGERFRTERRRDVGGGCINRACVVEGGARRYFVKLNDAAGLAMFEAEAEGLRELRVPGSLRVPAPVAAGRAGGEAFLVMEHVAMGRGDGAAEVRLGRGLAALHRHRGARFGWRMDNTIGSTPQRNTPCDDWVEFYGEHRLRPQLELAARAGHRGALARDGERLIGLLGRFFGDYRPAASLLHGDLWGGNWSADAQGAPVIFDPAVYYGDREADLAMTELFGGFGRDFYAAYREVWPLDPGYGVRRTLYNLYHVLNHLNLFGGGYRGQAESMLGRLLAEASG